MPETNGDLYIAVNQTEREFCVIPYGHPLVYILEPVKPVLG